MNRPPDAEPIPISYGAASAVTKRYIKDEEPAHRVASEPNLGFIRKRAYGQINSRRDVTLSAQLRSGHCLGLAHYKNRLDPIKGLSAQELRKRIRQYDTGSDAHPQ